MARLLQKLVAVSAFALTFHPLIAIAHESLTWTGCGITKKAFMAELAAAYKSKTGIDIELSGGGATKGIRFAASKLTDMGGSCRHRLVVDGIVVGTEKRTRIFQVAWDALVPITHISNPVNGISIAHIKKIYNSRINNWKLLGGDNEPIHLATRAGRHSGVGQMFRALVFGYQEHEFLAPSQVFPSTGPLERYIESTPYSLAMDGVSSANKSKVKILMLDGVRPTKNNIRSGTYPLFRPLYLVTNADPDPAVLAFIEFALSPAGQAVISSQGTVNLEEGRELAPLWERIRRQYGL
jgi:phosphate transport system substrate-binding protein